MADTKVDRSGVEDLLSNVRDGTTGVDQALEDLASLPLLDLGHSTLDTQRSLRCGFGEVVFGEGKQPQELVEIARAQLSLTDALLVTRVSEEGAHALTGAVPRATWHEASRLVTVGLPREDAGTGDVLVVAAGTSDGPVAEEAALSARMLGARVEQLRDVGVAGLHRLLASRKRLRRARVLVVVAGMEGALPSVVAGLVAHPVIALPTSVGYGTGLGGIAALLGMLNSCAAGVSVVNIDNGFGAGFAAARINALVEEAAR